MDRFPSGIAILGGLWNGTPGWSFSGARDFSLCPMYLDQPFDFRSQSGADVGVAGQALRAHLVDDQPDILPEVFDRPAASPVAPGGTWGIPCKPQAVGAVGRCLRDPLAQR